MAWRVGGPGLCAAVWLGKAPTDLDQAWEQRLHGGTAGLVVTDTYGMRGDPTGLDFGCGPLRARQLVRLDFEASCRSQLEVPFAVDGLSADADGSLYVDVDGVSAMPSTFVHLDAADHQVFRSAYAHVLPGSLTLQRPGRLVGLRQGELVFLSPTLEVLDVVPLPLSAAGPLAVGPDGSVALVGRGAQAEPVTWGAHSIPAGAGPVLLTVRPDGSPGGAVVLGSSGAGAARTAADAAGVVYVEASDAGLEVHTLGWDGEAHEVRRVPAHRLDTCREARECPVGLDSVAVDPVHGIRIAGVLHGDVHLDPALLEEAHGPGHRLAFVLALSR